MERKIIANLLMKGLCMSENTASAEKISFFTIFLSSLLVLGNVLGVGVLALPITAGLGGFIPALIGIVLLWLVMLLTAFIITYRIDPNKKNFDLPSFYEKELGSVAAKWIAIICNLIILYGVLVAYLSGITTMISALFPGLAKYGMVVLVVYFCIAVSIIIFGISVLRKSMLFLMIALWICFGIMIYTGLGQFDGAYLDNMYWFYLPVVLPIAVSTFHFHNIIPTVSKSLNYNKPATYKAIFLGVFIGLLINVIWVTVVLGTLPENGPGTHTVVYANIHGWAANVPMSELLHNHYFTIAGLIFSVIAVTSSFAANGAGLYGFIKDILYHHFKTENSVIASAVAFLPPLIVTIVYPNLFLSALSIVGGVGEDILFAILPAFVLIKISSKMFKSPGLAKLAKVVGVIMAVVGFFVLIYVIATKFGLLDMTPHFTK